MFDQVLEMPLGCLRRLKGILKYEESDESSGIAIFSHFSCF